MRLDWDTVPSAMDFNLQSQIMAVAPRKISQMLVEVTVLTNFPKPRVLQYQVCDNEKQKQRKERKLIHSEFAQCTQVTMPASILRAVIGRFRCGRFWG